MVTFPAGVKRGEHRLLFQKRSKKAVLLQQRYVQVRARESFNPSGVFIQQQGETSGTMCRGRQLQKRLKDTESSNKRCFRLRPFLTKFDASFHSCASLMPKDSIKNSSTGKLLA